MVMKVVPLSDLQRYNVNRPGQEEGIWQPQYDYQTYATAGTTSMSFFQVPQGQGGKTIADTNIEQAGALPIPKRFLVQAIEVVFYSGVTPSTFGAGAAANYINDVHAIAKSGHLQFFIGSKAYLDEAPIGVFPASFGIGGFAAASDASTAAASQQTLVQYGRPVGRTYEITPILIPSQQNFKVILDWPAVVATPSGVDGRIGVRLLGTLYRNSQ